MGFNSAFKGLNGQMMQLQMRCEEALSRKYTEFCSGHPAVFMNLNHYSSVKQSHIILFRNGHMFRPKKTIINPSFQKL